MKINNASALGYSDFGIWHLFAIWILTFGFSGRREEGGAADTIFLLLMGD